MWTPTSIIIQPKKRGWIASLHFVNIRYTIIHAFYTNNYLMWIVKNESRITYQDTQHMNTQAGHIMWTIDHVKRAAEGEGGIF